MFGNLYCCYEALNSFASNHLYVIWTDEIFLFLMAILIVDCIDCAAEASVVNAVNDGIEAARSIFPVRRPWVMISVNDDEDLHFRKAGTFCSPSKCMYISICSLWFKN